MSPKTLLAAGFALTTLVAGGLAWNLHLENLRLSTQAALLESERADLQAKLREAQRVSAFSVNVAATSPDTSPLPPSLGADEPSGAPQESGQPPRRDSDDRRSARMEELMRNPEFLAAMTAQAKARLDRQYADLFKRLNLPPATLEQLKSLLTEKQTARMDVMAAARAEGLDPRDNREQIATLMQQTQAELDNAIAAAIGPDAYAAYQTYEQTAPQRAAVGQLEERLSYSSTPLTTAQSEQLVTILSNQNSATGSATSRRGRTAVTITDQVITQAAAVLSPTQLTALKELQTTQQAGRVMGEAFRAAGGGGGPGGD